VTDRPALLEYATNRSAKAIRPSYPVSYSVRVITLSKCLQTFCYYWHL